MNNDIKNFTLRRWNEVFPYLKSYSSNSLFMHLGPLMIGVRIEYCLVYPLYSIYLQIIPLWMGLRDARKENEGYYGRSFSNARADLLNIHATDTQFASYVSLVEGQFGRMLQPEIPLSVLVDFLFSFKEKNEVFLLGYLTTVFKILFGLATYLDNDDFYLFQSKTFIYGKFH